MKSVVLGRKPTCAVQLDCNLEELRRVQDLESLRGYLVRENCFPSQKDAHAARITIDELKKLARAWKLNERRNFWKTHATEEALLEVLLKHVTESNGNTNPKPEYTAPISSITNPSPPKAHKPSLKFKPKFRGKNNKMKYYCGYPMLNKVRDTRELMARSRFYVFPSDETNLDSMIAKWRENDFRRQPTAESAEPSIVIEEEPSEGVEEDAAAVQQRVERQRSLSLHLLHYSTSADVQLTRKTVETFLNVADCDDTVTVVNCAVALSNIASLPVVRGYLLELNAMHKFTSMLPHLRSSLAMLACGRFLYYMSCEHEIEDRICNSGFKAFQTNSSSESQELRVVTVQCLANLLPCTERLRVAELAVTSIHQLYRDFGSEIWNAELLQVLLNLTAFSNTHYTVVEADIMDILAIACADIDKTDVVSGRLLVQILSNFLHSSDVYEDIIQSDYCRIFIDLLAFEDSTIIEGCVHALVVMSSLELFTASVCDNDIINVICSLLQSNLMTEKLALNCARYLSNISVPKVKDPVLLVQAGVMQGLLYLLATYKQEIRRLALAGVRDLLRDHRNCVETYDVVVPVLLQLITDFVELPTAIECLHNVACTSSLHAKLVEHRVHLILNDLIMYGDNLACDIKSAILHVIISLTANAQCISDLLAADIIVQLINLTATPQLWAGVSKLTLAIVATKPALSDEQRDGIIKILRIIGTKNSSDDIIGECAIVLAFLSLDISDFRTVDGLIRAVLSISESEVVIQAASTVLYNVSCGEDALMLLEDGLMHINIMIHMMRSGNAQVQENIAETMRNLCVHPKCIQLLLKHDLLSDFIVIALLRTNSNAVKKTCSEAFYNMLCHRDCRQKLLQGDLWWALMRLSKSDLEAVKVVCARALFNLASSAEHITALRHNHVFAFAKEITLSGAGEFLDIFLQVIFNIVKYCVETPLQHAEVQCVVQICLDALHKTTALSSVRCLCYLLCCVSQHSSVVNEFLLMDVMTVLHVSQYNWNYDPQCRTYMASMMANLCAHEAFTVATPFADVSSNLALVLVDATDAVYEHVVLLLLRYASRNQIDRAKLLELPVFSKLLDVAFKSSAPAVAAKPAAIPSLASMPTVRNMKYDAIASLPPASPMAVAVIKLMANVLPNISEESPVLPIAPLLSLQYIYSIETRGNALYILHHLSQMSFYVPHFIAADVFHAVLSTLSSPYILSQTSILTTFSSMLRNLFCHTASLSQLVHVDSGAMTVLRSMVQIMRDVVEPKPEASTRLLHDLTTIIYHTASATTSIPTNFLLDLISQLNQLSPPKTVSHILKQVVGNIMNSTAHSTTTFDPSFVQAVLSEIHDAEKPPSDEISAFVALQQLSLECDISSIAAPFAPHQFSLPSAPEHMLWTPISDFTRKKMEYFLPTAFNAIKVVCSSALETLSPMPIPYFKKIVTTYDLIHESEVAEMPAAPVLASVPEDDGTTSPASRISPQHTPSGQGHKTYTSL